MVTAGHTCPICQEVLRDPYQATCCGKNFCKECVHRVKAANEPCPTCRKRDFHFFHDKRLQQVLYNFRVDCTHKNEGCEWTGELRELDEHLSDAHSGEPPRANSRQRTTKLEGKVDQTMVLPPQPITGTYTPVDAKFTMDNFDKHKRDKDTWYSPHFYTHPNGYKMCLRVDANGNASGRGTHLSVFVCLMQGEFDDQLKWSFKGNITIQLVNQEEDIDHVTKTFYSRSAGKRCERVMSKKHIDNAWGIGRFLSHAELQPKYLKNDCIKFYIKIIDLY